MPNPGLFFNECMHNPCYNEKAVFNRFELTKNEEEKICCRSEECLATSSRVKKLLDPDVLQVMLSSRHFDAQDHSTPTAANCRQV